MKRIGLSSGGPKTMGLTPAPRQMQLAFSKFNILWQYAKSGTLSRKAKVSCYMAYADLVS